MKKLFFSAIIVSFFISASFAGDFTYQEKRELRDAGYSNSDIRKIERGQRNVEPTYKYESAAGNRYKYDLSDPSDRLEYSMDIGAQLDDSINMPVNPSTSLDRSMGQFGGGLMD